MSPPSEGEVDERWGSDCESGAFPRQADEMITDGEFVVGLRSVGLREGR